MQVGAFCSAINLKKASMRAMSVVLPEAKLMPQAADLERRMLSAPSQTRTELC